MMRFREANLLAPGREGVGLRRLTPLVGRAGAFSPWCSVSGGAQPVAGMHQGLPDWMFLQLAGMRLNRIPVLSALRTSAAHACVVTERARRVMRHGGANLTQVAPC
jgi:hypothetical protein